jgi:sensor histidine kinase regulating citrate/malate metabolism
VKDNVNQNGIGFGLTISKMIVENLGGEMVLRNHTNFDKLKVKLPMRRKTSCEASVYSKELTKSADLR